MAIDGSGVGWGPDAANLKEKITAAVVAITDPAEKARAADGVLLHASQLRTVALSLIDTPGLSPSAQRIADALGGLYKGRREPRNLVASWLYRAGRQEKVRVWYGTSKTDLKRILVLVSVREHALYVRAANAWMVQARTPNVTQASADYQTCLKDEIGRAHV